MEFDVRDLFMFGSPVPLVLAFRKMSGESLKLKSDADSGKIFDDINLIECLTSI